LCPLRLKKDIKSPIISYDGDTMARTVPKTKDDFQKAIKDIDGLLRYTQNIKQFVYNFIRKHPQSISGSYSVECIKIFDKGTYLDLNQSDHDIPYKDREIIAQLMYYYRKEYKEYLTVEEGIMFYGLDHSRFGLRMNVKTIVKLCKKYNIRLIIDETNISFEIKQITVGELSKYKRKWTNLKKTLEPVVIEQNIKEFENKYHDDELTDSGWLSPLGYFYKCAHGQHIERSKLIARELYPYETGDSEQILEAKGWLKCTNKKWYALKDSLITAAQRERLVKWQELHGAVKFEYV